VIKVKGVRGIRTIVGGLPKPGAGADFLVGSVEKSRAKLDSTDPPNNGAS